MKKLLPLMILMSGISFGMTGSVRDAYTEVVQKWAKYSDLYEGCRVAFGRGYEFRSTPEFAAKEKERDAAEPERFDQAILHRVILEEVGEDAVAQQMLQMLYERKLHDVPYFYLENADGMTPENREKFKELLLPLAPIIKVGHASLVSTNKGTDEYLPKSEYRPHVDKIVSIWGGDAGTITPETIQHPQFCHKVLMKITLDLDKSGSGMLFQSFDCMVGELTGERFNWPGKIGETAIYEFAMPCYEDEGGACSMSDVWQNYWE